jgi:hypothetical protein
MKNWLPLEFFPELHMATCSSGFYNTDAGNVGLDALTTPLSVNFCCNPAFSSLKVPPQMLCGSNINTTAQLVKAGDTSPPLPFSKMKSPP